ncbi:hypothetical protein [Ferrimonas senticii]|uniref:hypothetical protein n=1 Tax=Ferrimonas senticii TaxID=394566 RepID=UPI0004860EF1|nr:hypothetical protein [Ferrimonas senticii]
MLDSLIEAYVHSKSNPYSIECVLVSDAVYAGDGSQHREEAGHIGSIHDGYFNTKHYTSQVGRFMFMNDRVVSVGDKLTIVEDGFGSITWDKSTNTITAEHFGTSIDRKMTYACSKK